jgi:hypothetical protein
MEQIALNQLPGYQKPFTVDGTDLHMTHFSNHYHTRFARMQHITWQDRLEQAVLPERQLVAPYVAKLILPVCQKIQQANYRFVGTRPRASTGLTELFKAYGMDVHQATGHRRASIAIRCPVAKLMPQPYMLLSYYGERKRPFWQILLHGSYGNVVNMYCTSQESPLRGAGNIALIPGVAVALARDLHSVSEAIPDPAS